MNAKQKAFVREYVKDFNATQAAIRAGYSKKTAGVQSHELLKKPEIKAAIEAKQAKAEDRAAITVDEIVARLAGIARAGLGDILDWDEETATLIAKADMGPEALAAVKTIKQTVVEVESNSDDTVRISRNTSASMHDPIKAMELLGRYLGAFTEKHEISGKLSLVDAIRGVSDSDGE